VPLGWTMELSIIETAPVEGRKRYETVSSWRAVSARALNRSILERGG
jgi:hypothetical protein